MIPRTRLAFALFFAVGATLGVFWVSGAGDVSSALRHAAITVSTMVAVSVTARGLHLARPEDAALLLLAAHTLVFPALYAWLGISRLPLDDSQIVTALAAHLALLGVFVTTLLALDAREHQTNPTHLLPNALERWADAVPARGATIVAAVVAAGACSYLLLTARSGYFFAFGDVARGAAFIDSGEERWWHLRLAIQGGLLWTVAIVVGRHGRDRLLSVIALIGVSAFALSIIGLGGRRDLVGLLVPGAVIAWAWAHTPRQRLAVALIGGVSIAALAGFALVRTGPLSRSLTDPSVALDLLGEFVFPWQVTAQLAADTPPLLLGSSYLNPLVLWIPRSLWPDKPVMLAQQFVDLVGTRGEVGFGASPIAEAVWNFGWTFGPIVGGVVLALILQAGGRWAATTPLLYLAMIGRIPSVPRSEFAGVLGEVLILGVVFVALRFAARVVEARLPRESIPTIA